MTVVTRDVLKLENRRLITFNGILNWLKLSSQIARERKQLAALDDAGLKDIGLSRAEIREELLRPVWDWPERFKK